jgi:hypothetical protein
MAFRSGVEFTASSAERGRRGSDGDDDDDDDDESVESVSLQLLVKTITVDRRVRVDKLLSLLRERGHEVRLADAQVALNSQADDVPFEDAVAFATSSAQAQRSAADAAATLPTAAGDKKGRLEPKTRIRRVGLWEWLRSRLPFVDKDPKVQVVWDRQLTLSALSTSPKSQLAALGALVVSWTALGILLVFAFMWRSHAQDVSAEHLARTTQTTIATVERFQRQLTDVSLETLRINAVVFGSFVGSGGVLREETSVAHTQHVLGTVVGAEATTGAAADLRTTVAALQKFAIVSAALPPRTLADQFIVLDRLVGPGVQTIMAGLFLTNGGIIVTRTGTAMTATTSRCLSAVQGHVQGSLDVDVFGGSSDAAVAVELLTTSAARVRVCVFVNATHTAATNDRVVAAVTRVKAWTRGLPLYRGDVGADKGTETVVVPDCADELPCRNAVDSTYSAQQCAVMRQLQRNETAVEPTVIDFSKAAQLDSTWVASVTRHGTSTVSPYVLATKVRLLPGWHNNTVVIIDYLNFAFLWTTEMWIGWHEPGGLTVLQANAFRFQANCFSQCDRSLGTSAEVMAQIDQRHTGSAMQGDYRPQPVTTGFAFIDDYDATVLIDRDVVEVNNFAINALVQIFDKFNDENFAGLTIFLQRDAARPATKTYPPTEACPQNGVTCVELPNVGVVYRDDCQYCARYAAPVPENFTLEVLTRVGGFASGLRLPQAPEALQLPFTRPRTVVRTVLPDDGMKVVGHGFFVANYSLGVTVTESLRNEGDAKRYADTSVGLSSFVGVATAVLLLSVIRRLLRGVETEWRRTKQRISDERLKFVDNVRDFMPQFLVPQLSKRFPAVHYASAKHLTLLFLEMCNMRDRYRIWSPTLVARFASYQQFLLDTLFLHYSLHKVQPIGDRVFAISGVDDDTETTHHAVRAVVFATALHRLSGPDFAHFPGRVAPLLKSFGPAAATQFPNVDGPKDFVGCVEMPSYRVGIHAAECTAVVTPIAGAPHFDVYGTAVGAALHVMQHAPPGCIVVTTATKDAVHTHDTQGVITMRPYAHIKLRNRLRIATFLVLNGKCPLPHAAMHELSIRPAVRLVDCNADEGRTTDSGAPTRSTVSSQSGVEA